MLTFVLLLFSQFLLLEAFLQAQTSKIFHTLRKEKAQQKKINERYPSQT
jgi:hypothetical protein